MATEALLTLTRRFGRLAEVRQFVIAIVKGVAENWQDIIGDMRLQALAVSGDLLEICPIDIELVKALMELVEDEQEETKFRNAAYTALRRIEVSRNTLPDFNADNMHRWGIEDSFIQRVHKLITTN